MRIVRYITIFRDAGDFWPYRLSRRPCRRRWCELPRLDFGSDWTTGTAALVSRGLTSSATQIARYLAILSAAKIFGAVASLITTKGGDITTRAVGHPQLGLWYLVGLRGPL